MMSASNPAVRRGSPFSQLDIIVFEEFSVYLLEEAAGVGVGDRNCSTTIPQGESFEG